MIDSSSGVPRPALPSQVLEAGVIAIARGLPARRLVDVAAALRAGGVGAFEVTLDSPDALEGIAAVAAAGRAKVASELLVGAGTVLSIAEAAAALDAGARFLVMPHVDVELVAWAASRGVPVLPGAMSPTEILAAWRAGAAAVKVFPAVALGPSFVREVRGPLAAIPLVPTGGITAETAGAFFDAGAAAVGVGGWLTGSGEPDLVRPRAAALVTAIARARR